MWYKENENSKFRQQQPITESQKVIKGKRIKLGLKSRLKTQDTSAKAILLVLAILLPVKGLCGSCRSPHFNYFIEQWKCS